MSVDQHAATLVRAPRGWQRVTATLSRVGAFAIVEIQKLQYDRTELVTRMVLPALWLLIFGATFSHFHVIRIGVVFGFPGAGNHRTDGAVHLHLLWDTDHLTTDPLRILAAMGIVMLGAAFFVSNALYPVDAVVLVAAALIGIAAASTLVRRLVT